MKRYSEGDAVDADLITLLFNAMRCVADKVISNSIRSVDGPNTILEKKYVQLINTRDAWFGTFSFLTKRMTEKVGVYASNYMHNNQFLVQAASHHS